MTIEYVVDRHDIRGKPRNSGKYAMRKKSQRQLPLDFSGTQRRTREYYRLYARIDEILEEHSEMLGFIHKVPTAGCRKKKYNVAGGASETTLRLIIVHRIEGLSLRDLIVRVGDSQMLRFFVKVYDGKLLDYSTFGKLKNHLRPKAWDKLNEILQQVNKDKGEKGKKLRIDRTVTGSNVLFPRVSNL